MRIRHGLATDGSRSAVRRQHVGWDWASQNHDATVIDDAGAIQARFAIGHDEASLRGLLDDLASLAAPADLPVAIERPDGIIVERLLAGGHPVAPVHPNAFPRRSTALGCRACEVRPRRQLHARRLPPHRREPPPTPATARHRYRGAASARADARRPRHRPHRRYQPTSRPAHLAMFCRRHSYRGGAPCYGSRRPRPRARSLASRKTSSWCSPESQARRQVGAERLLHDDARPGDEVGVGQHLDGAARGAWRDARVVQPTGPVTELGLGLLDRAMQRAGAARRRHEVQGGDEGRHLLGRHVRLTNSAHAFVASLRNESSSRSSIDVPITWEAGSRPAR